MATTVDHLRVDHRVTVLRSFTDAKGVSTHVGHVGILRELLFDQIAQTIHMAIEGDSGSLSLTFALIASDGPRIGHMREYFEVGDYVPAEQEPPKHRIQPGRANPEKRWEEGDRLERAEQEILNRYDHIGAAASVAAMYAQRMRAFGEEGDEVRAAAAGRLALHWMQVYASCATSGGEGAALSYERDKFHAQLVGELGYDPTEGDPQ